MKKDDALKLLCGGKVNASMAARALGVSRYIVHRWPDPLPQPIADQVRGAYARITEERDRQAVSAFGG